MSDFTSFSDTFGNSAYTYRTNNLGGLLMKEANLEDLTLALSHYFVDSLVTTDKSIPPQVEYAKIVNSGLTRLNFFKFVGTTLHRMLEYADSEFANFTVLSRVNSFTRITKEEFEDSKGYYPYRSVLEQRLSDVQPLELVRAVRLVLQKLVYRFFHTYDVDETREVGKKQVKVCDAASATFRRGEHNIATAEFCDFIEDLLDACRCVNEYSAELTEFRDVFVNAARTAKQMRESYLAEHPRPQQSSQQRPQQSSQQRPQQSSQQRPQQSSQQRPHQGSQNHSQQQKGQPRFKPQGRFAQPKQQKQVTQGTQH